jgi:hypothetical protein
MRVADCGDEIFSGASRLWALCLKWKRAAPALAASQIFPEFA